MKKIITCLWFDSNAEELVKYYKTVFQDDVTIGETTYYQTETPSNKPVGSVLTIGFELFGQKFIALNGGSFFKLSEAVSFMIECENQKEIDYYWEKLSAVPESEQCGWCKDKFGVSWQIVPKQLSHLLSGDPKKSKKVMEAFLPMKKLDLEKLQEVYNS